MCGLVGGSMSLETGFKGFKNSMPFQFVLSASCVGCKR